MKHLGMFALLMMFCSFTTGNLERQQESSQVESSIVKGKVYRSDTNEPIPNSYILLEKDSPAPFQHFDVRTDENGNYRFDSISAGKYTVSIYAWFRKKSDVPCQNSSEGKTAGDGTVIVGWQRKSDAFIEIVTIKGFSMPRNGEKIKDFDLVCR